ncbi:FAD-dependent oxidoreductase [Vampirovibrio sp.]|uniref:FAD-dependent oxidoreductase n=1 Tax=Vampirovibrio sp. TaxID=2717857 RepID=UPI003592F98B
MMEPHPCQVLVMGDEVESILTAISASQTGAKTVLARRSSGRLGGLSVRGGLSYMDITPEYLCGLFKTFLDRCGFIRVALNPDKADQVLRDMLQEAQVEVLSGVEAQLTLDGEGFPRQVVLTAPNQSVRLTPQVVIDATPDADVARSLGLAYIQGLGGILGEDQDFLGISPVFRITGVLVAEFQAFEAQLRKNPLLPQILKEALPYHPSALREELIDRPTYAPEGQDYLDILNPVIGIDYHCWRHGSARTYADADILIDGGNVSRLADGSLGFNGLVAQANALNLGFDHLVGLSQDGPTPEVLYAEMREFERYLREVGGFQAACVIPPESLYVRQTATLMARENMTARKAIEGGVPPEKSIGTFSYWLDLRGTQLWKLYPGEHLPKPVFNVGLDVVLPYVSPHAPCVQNFAFVSRSAGYSPIGQGAGRIVQHNALLGEGVGIAAALAIRHQKPLADIVDSAVPEIQTILKQRLNGPLLLEGRPTWSLTEIESSVLLKRDAAIVEAFKNPGMPVV